MVITGPAAAEIRRLIAALSGDDDLRREVAIARLAVIGAPAVDRLIAAYTSASARATRIGILRSLDATSDPRVLGVARAALADGGDLGVAAAAALRGQLGSADEPTATRALDALVAAVLDAGAEHRVRLAAYDALQDMPAAVRDPITAALQAAPDPTLTSRLLNGPGHRAAAEAIWQDALQGVLPDQPSLLRGAFDAHVQGTPLGTLQHLIDVVRSHEGTSPRAHRAGWLAIRGSLHQALALRGSRVALYDLRESLEQADEPLPVSFLAAVHVVGDRSCLEALAAAYSRGTDARWRQQIAVAFTAVAKRERLTRRHAEMKRIAARWPDVVSAMRG